MSIETHLLALTLAFIIDLIIGDPRWLPHPVRGMGKLISLFERFLNKGTKRKLRGVIFLLVYLTIIVLIVWSILFLAYKFNWYFGLFIESFIISTTIATKGLKEAALQVYQPLKDGDFVRARANLAMIVGRDTENLNEGEIVRGAVETVAENTSDGITAPLFYAFFGGGVLAILYRAVNTCDSMVGYRNERYSEFGFASARFDDVLNYLPSRISGSIMLIFNKPLESNKHNCFNILLRDARKHPSPNSGWLEAAMAGLLAVQLGGRNTYKGIESLRAKMGDPLTSLHSEHIIVCNRIMMRTCIGFVIFLWLIGGLIYAIS
nr:cobalamin biosynthesis protein [Anaerobacillus isosaccharinicus]QOY38767.1 cobalamin biosynthesis protein [Anaerobacillus isosaccharinicus]